MEEARKLAKEKNIAILSSLHDLNQALAFGDKFFFLKNGVVQYAGGREIITPEVARPCHCFAQARLRFPKDRGDAHASMPSVYRPVFRCNCRAGPPDPWTWKKPSVPLCVVMETGKQLACHAGDSWTSMGMHTPEDSENKSYQRPIHNVFRYISI